MGSEQYWDNRYAAGYSSGYGSYGDQLEKKLKWLSGLDIQSITEIGCGDFNFGKRLLEMYHVPYTGLDISKVIIERNQIIYPEHTFTMMHNNPPKADLLLCIDVILHIMTDEELEEMYQTLERTWTKYLAVTAYERDEDLGTHVRIRKFPVERFGTPIIREVVEEDGSMYFYLFKKEEKKADIRTTSCCLITKEKTYPKEVLDHVAQYPFGEIQILTHCDSPHRKQELFEKAKYDWIFYQDDDAIGPIPELFDNSFDGITCAMKTKHIEAYKDSKIALLGWGSVFPKSCIKVLDRYRAKYGEDEVYKRETERIMTYFNYPQKRLDLPIMDLLSAYLPDRLSMQPNHYDYIPIVEERCRSLE